MGFPTTDLLYSTDRVLKTIKKIHFFKISQPLVGPPPKSCKNTRARTYMAPEELLLHKYKTSTSEHTHTHTHTSQEKKATLF